MISCGNCAFQNESGDAFCGSCGTYLEWASEPAKPVAVAATAGTGSRGGVALAPDPPAEVRRAAQVEADAAARQEEAARRAAAQASRAKAEAETRAEAEAAGRAEAEAEARAKAEEDRKAQDELKRRAEEEAEARRRAEKEANRLQSAADQARAEANLERRRQAEARIRQEAEARAKEAAAARAQADAEARRRAEAEAKARREVERQRQEESNAQARAEAAEARAATARAALLVAPEPVVTERPPEVEGDTPAGKGRPPTPAGKTPSEVDLTDTGATVAPTVAARQPEAMKPTAVKRPPPVAKAPPTTEPQMGDLICDQCTEGNLRTRKFCRRCGASLFEAQPYVPPAVAAGERPMLRGGSRSRPRKVLEFLRRYAKVVFALLAVLVLLGPLSSPIKKAVKKVTRTRDYVQVRPYNAEGVGTAGHGPLLAIDRDTESYWSDGQAWTDARRNNANKPDLTITFEKETDLDRIGIYSGAGDVDFEEQPRPRAILVEFIGPRYSRPQLQYIRRLEDKPTEQLFDLEAKYPVQAIRITVQDVFLALGDKERHTSLASFEFFDKQ